MNKVDKIKEIIRKYQNKMNKKHEAYQKAEREAREKLSPAGFRSEFMQKTWVQFASESWSAADIAVLEANNILDEIREDLSEWLMKPLDSRMMQTFDCINRFGLSMSFDELQILEQGVLSSGSYLGCRIFDGLCQENGYGTSRPPLKTITDSLQNAHEEIDLAVRAYAGKAPDFPGRDLLGEYIYRGVSYGSFTDYQMYDADHFLDGGGRLDDLSRLLDSMNAPVAYTLNQSEAAKMKTELKKIVDKNGKVDEKAAQQLEKNDPDFINKLRSMPEGAFKNMESVFEYFRLDEKENKKVESVLMPSLEQAKLYNSNFVPADLKVLDQYK